MFRIVLYTVFFLLMGAVAYFYFQPIPGDKPAKEMIEACKKYTAQIKEDKFDGDAFKAEMLPIIKEIYEMRQKESDLKLKVSEDVLEEYESAIDGLADAAKESENIITMLTVGKMNNWFEGKFPKEESKDDSANPEEGMNVSKGNPAEGDPEGSGEKKASEEPVGAGAGE